MSSCLVAWRWQLLRAVALVLASGPFVNLFGRQAAWRPGDAEQALCLDSDEAGFTISLEDRTPIISGARHVTNSLSSFRVVTRLS